MALLTKKEYLELEKKEIKKSEITVDEIKLSAVVEEKKFIYFLLYPENVENYPSNFEDIIKIDNKEYKRKCENGIVKTNEHILADFLLKKGYILLEKLEDNNG